ncbi:MAG: phage late control D family protein [Myxococcota bacterium]|jgi:phage protein D
MDKNTPTINVKIAGNTKIATDSGDKLETRGGSGILSVTVDLRLDNPDMFSVEYDMMKLESLNLIDSFKPGDTVEISLGLTEESVLCEGEIAYIEPSFDVDAGYRTTISGYHKLHRLTRGQRSRVWGDGLAAETAPTTAVQQVLNESKASVGGASDSISAGEVTAAQVKLNYIPQLNMSDFEFLRAIGANLEYKADRKDGQAVKFTKPNPKSEAVAKLSRDRADPSAGEDSLILSANFRLSTVQQYAAVEVRGWDPIKKKAIVEKVTSSTYVFDESVKGHQDTGKGLYNSASAGRKYTVVDQPVESAAEAKQIAQALFDQFSMDFLTGEAVIKGDPKLIPGATVEFVGFGKAFSGKYLITSATHSYRPEEGYRTAIAYARNAKGA